MKGYVNQDNSENASRDRAPEIISIKQYRNIKRNLEEMEATNFDSIIAIPCNGSQDWHEIAEHSALFYYYEVCRKLKLKNKFMADTMSFYNQYQIGYIRSLGVDAIRQNLKKVDLYKAEERRAHFTIFKLKKSFTEAEIKALEHAENERRLHNLTVADTNNLDPELHQILVNLAIRLHRICNSRLDRLSSQTIGVDIIRLIDDALEKYHQLTLIQKGSKEKILDKLHAMRKDIYLILIKVKVIGEAKLWDLELCASISEPLNAAKEEIEKNLRKLIKKEKSNDRTN